MISKMLQSFVESIILLNVINNFAVVLLWVLFALTFFTLKMNFK